MIQPLSHFLHVASTFSDVVHCHQMKSSVGTLWVAQDHMCTKMLSIHTGDNVGTNTWSTRYITQVQEDHQCKPCTPKKNYVRCESILNLTNQKWVFTFNDVHDFIRHVCNLAVMSSPVDITIDTTENIIQFTTNSELGTITQRYPITIIHHSQKSILTTISIRGIKTIVPFLTHTNTLPQNNLPILCNLTNLGLTMSLHNISLLLESC